MIAYPSPAAVPCRVAAAMTSKNAEGEDSESDSAVTMTRWEARVSAV
ncbi:Uncharacterised protein [Mycobacteroides abscessus subsp. abscessus]|nr:Uncharacterised protein [Mycobacteroides abscessus subsp. abscessus]